MRGRAVRNRKHGVRRGGARGGIAAAANDQYRLPRRHSQMRRDVVTRVKYSKSGGGMFVIISRGVYLALPG